MATKNRRVAAYLPPEIDEKFKAFKLQNGLATEDDPKQNDSQALIQILSEYLRVSHSVAHSEKPDFESRLGALETKVAHFFESVNERLNELSISVEIAQQSACKTVDEVPQKDKDLPDQMSLLVEPGNFGDSSSDSLSELRRGVSARTLEKRWPVTRKVIGLRRSSPDFRQWSAQQDPDGIAWEYRLDTKRYYPVN